MEGRGGKKKTKGKFNKSVNYEGSEQRKGGENEIKENIGGNS